MASKKPKRWMQKLKLKKGALSKTLGVPEKKNIPMSKINKAKKSKNPTTRKRATLAATFKKIASKRKKK